MRALALSLMLVCLAVPASSAEVSADESLVSERLASRALGVLDGMLGPGRAKILVEVRGERLQIRTETELLTPLPAPPNAASTSQATPDGSNEASRLLNLPGYYKELYNSDTKTPQGGSPRVQEALRVLDLPGYYKNRPGSDMSASMAQSAQSFQKDFEHSLRDAGFEIKKIEATVVLDTALTEAEAREAAQILPQLLRIDGTRGDVISIVRAPMRPAWKVAFSTPGDWRKLAFGAAGLLAAVLIVMILSSAFVRGARAFAKELTSKQGQPERLESGMGEPLPELMPGGVPMELVEAGGGESGGGPFPALGRRFDFLETADAAGAARILAEEPAADLAQIFAYLAKLAPETASRLFAKLPAEVQADASSAILKLRAVDPERLTEIEDRIKIMVANGLRGSQRLATILSRFPGEDRAMLMERLASLDSRGAEEIESQLFAFEDIAALSAADLRRVIVAVPYDLWGTALRGSPQGLIDRVMAELPDGPRGLVREEVANPQPKDKVVAARSKVLDTFLDLAAKGQVKLDQRTESEDTL